MTKDDYKPSTLEAQRQGIVKPLDPEPLAYRLEIDEFVQNGPALNLFLLALEALQNNDIVAATKKDWKNADLDDVTWLEKLSNNEKYWWSYFGIAGLHGEPNQPWIHKHFDGDKYDPEKPPAADYCRHGLRVFPTWHRPYLFMMEQAIFNKMYKIAREFPEVTTQKPGVPTRDDYINAARTFRLPYWDPWMPRNSVDLSKKPKNRSGIFGFPAILKASEVYVRRPKPDSELEEIHNPLYSYKVPRDRDLLPGAHVPWTDFGQSAEGMAEFTVRSPSGQLATKNNDVVLEYEMRTTNLGQSSHIWQLLVRLGSLTDSWDIFSNHGISRKFRGKHPPEISIEGWHDNIHNLLGTGRNAAGNMTMVPYAAYDPIFWLHHCNVDRVLALYQVLHPDSYVPKEVPKDSEVDGEKKDENVLTTPLKPFFKDKGTDDEAYWTSADVEDWAQCGFAIPGTDSSVNKKELKKTVENYIRDTYLWTSCPEAPPPPNLQFPKEMDTVEALIGVPTKQTPRQNTVRAVGYPEGEPSILDRQVAVDAGAKLSPDKVLPSPEPQDLIDTSLFSKEIIEQGGQDIWNAHFTVKKYTFNGSFNVNFFLGNPKDEDAADFALLNNQIGYSGIFANSPSVECKNCKVQERAQALYGDVVPLTSELSKYLKGGTNNAGVPDSKRTLASLKPKDVVPFLRDNLKWRITLPDGALKSEDEVRASGLEIQIRSSWYNLPTPENALGSYTDSLLQAEITEGKTGGYTEA